MLGMDHLIFEGGLEDLENKIPETLGERKVIMQQTVIYN